MPTHMPIGGPSWRDTANKLVQSEGMTSLLPLTWAQGQQPAAASCGSVSLGRSAAPLAAHIIAMTTEDHRHRTSEQTYRDLEQHYRHSPQYAAMVARYPQLRHWISVCRNADLVGDPPSGPLQPLPADVVLQWDRSHGES